VLVNPASDRTGGKPIALTKMEIRCKCDEIVQCESRGCVLDTVSASWSCSSSIRRP
jgi:hypothetical protein